MALFKGDSSNSGGKCVMETMETADSHRIASTILVDLRKKPRYETQFAGEAISEKGTRAYATITNISRSGLRLEGAAQNIAAVLSLPTPSGPHSPTSLLVCFAIPRPMQEEGDVRVRCETVYLIEGQPHCVQVGMKFIAFDQGEDVLSRYISLRESGSASKG